jgi:hypothetical protein
VWRWSFIYLVLTADLGDSVLALSDGRHNRAMLILRRAMFEHMIRLKFYRKNPSIARAHLEDFERLAKRFQRRLDDDGFQLVLDAAFNAAAHDPQHYSFEQILRDLNPELVSDAYARFYTYPSALLHGDALASMDVLERRGDGSWRVHGISRRHDTDRDILYNYVVFFIALLQDAMEHFGVNLERLVALRARLGDVRKSLGIDPTGSA